MGSYLRALRMKVNQALHLDFRLLLNLNRNSGALCCSYIGAFEVNSTASHSGFYVTKSLQAHVTSLCCSICPLDSPLSQNPKPCKIYISLQRVSRLPNIPNPLPLISTPPPSHTLILNTPIMRYIVICWECLI